MTFCRSTRVPSVRRNHLSESRVAGGRQCKLTAALAAVMASALMTSCGGITASRSRLATGADYGYVLNQSGIVPMNLDTHAMGHLMSVPNWYQNAQLLIAADNRTSFVVDMGGIIPLDLALPLHAAIRR